jgi:hypothetical protein
VVCLFDCLRLVRLGRLRFTLASAIVRLQVVSWRGATVCVRLLQLMLVAGVRICVPCWVAGAAAPAWGVTCEWVGGVGMLLVGAMLAALAVGMRCSASISSNSSSSWIAGLLSPRDPVVGLATVTVVLNNRGGPPQGVMHQAVASNASASASRTSSCSTVGARLGMVCGIYSVNSEKCLALVLLLYSGTAVGVINRAHGISWCVISAECAEASGFVRVEL